jgi:ribose transport system permease protein
VTASTITAPQGSSWLEWVASARAWLFLILLLVFFELWAQGAGYASFVGNASNLQSIAVYAVLPLLLALGQTLVIIAGGIDLSVGFIMGLASVIMAVVTRFLGPVVGDELAFLGGVVAAFAAATVPGAINGILIAKLRVPPFIVTLGMYGVARGAAFLLAAGTTVPVSNPIVKSLANRDVWGIPIPLSVLITIVIVLGMHYVLSQTKFGQYTYAIGGNRAAAVRAGIDVPRHTIRLYIIAAWCAAAAGILYTGFFTAGAAQAGEPLLLDTVAAVVIGGASLFGGSGTIIGTVIGALIIAVIKFGLVFINVVAFWQFIAVGVVIVISVLVDQAQKRGAAGHREE